MKGHTISKLISFGFGGGGEARSFAVPQVRAVHAR